MTDSQKSIAIPGLYCLRFDGYGIMLFVLIILLIGIDWVFDFQVINSYSGYLLAGFIYCALFTICELLSACIFNSKNKTLFFSTGRLIRYSLLPLFVLLPFLPFVLGALGIPEGLHTSYFHVGIYLFSVVLLCVGIGLCVSFYFFSFGPVVRWTYIQDLRAENSYLVVATRDLIYFIRADRIIRLGRPLNKKAFPFKGDDNSSFRDKLNAGEILSFARREKGILLKKVI